MGIQGLLPLLKSIHKPTHLRNFAGQTLGVDAYGWLHRGTVSCAIELAQQKPTSKYVDFAMNRVRMLIHFGVKPFIVFDGDYLPGKAHTEKDRAVRRRESKKLGLELLRTGKTSQAHLELQKAVDVTPLMARELIEELKRAGVPYVVAPYEADAQLAYLEKQGVISGIISEDSDLLVFGVKCLITKLDQYGECIMINRQHFTACREISLVGWTDSEFRIMAMLSGCDYLPGIDKMGLKTAYRLVRKHKQVERIVKLVQFDGKMKIQPGYLEAFTNAERTFLYQWVFSLEEQCLVNLNDVPKELNVDDMPYIGRNVDSVLASGVAAGDLDPNTKEPIHIQATTRYSNHRATSSQTPDAKEGRPISEFFKARRTPLAELDPNSFTPSPTQQVVLETNRHSSWSATQLPPARSVSGRSNFLPVPTTAPQLARRATTGQTSNSRLSPKRQRLCADSVFALSMKGSVGLSSATSRFFSESSIVQASPSRRKASEQRKKLKDEFDVFNDETSGDKLAAVAEIPDVTAEIEGKYTPKRKRRLDVFKDGDIAKPLSRDPAKSPRGSHIASQTTTTATSSASSQHTFRAETPMTSFETASKSRSRKSLVAGFAAEKVALQKKNDDRSPPEQQGYIQPPRHTVLAEKEANDQTLAALQDSAIELCPQTPARPKDEVKVPGSSPLSLSLYTHHPSKLLPDASDAKDSAAQTEAKDVLSSITTKGSEDLLVPNSPEVEEDRGQARPKLNLGRFAYSG